MEEEVWFTKGDDGENIMHFGVKGMKWGVRRDGGSGSYEKGSTKAQVQSARRKVESGKATIGDAHTAALKSTSRRVANSLLGDKHYWKGAAYQTAGTLAGFAATVAVATAFPPAAVPMSYALYAGASATGVGLSVANTRRAITGNDRILKSRDALGKYVNKSATIANADIKKLLKKPGQLREKDFQGTNRTQQKIDKAKSKEAKHSLYHAEELLGDAWKRVNKEHNGIGELALSAVSLNEEFEGPEYFELNDKDRFAVDCVVGMMMNHSEYSKKLKNELEKVQSAEA